MDSIKEDIVEPPRWAHIHTVDELEAFYLSILPKLRVAARECGYALGVHGSMRRDLDLIAAPWIKDHSDKDTLATAIQIAATGGIRNDCYTWSNTKPCGRRGTVFPICHYESNITSGGCIDLAVMPDTDRLENL